jgi:hypothetical protein
MGLITAQDTTELHEGLEWLEPLVARSWPPSPIAGSPQLLGTTSTTERALPASAVQVAAGVGQRPLGCLRLGRIPPIRTA